MFSSPGTPGAVPDPAALASLLMLSSERDYKTFYCYTETFYWFSVKEKNIRKKYLDH